MQSVKIKAEKFFPSLFVCFFNNSKLRNWGRKYGEEQDPLNNAIRPMILLTANYTI